MQFSLRTLFLIVAVLAVGLTFMLVGADWTGDLLYTLYGGLLLLGLIGAVGFRQSRQAFCLGMLLVGAAYWYAAFHARDSDDPRFSAARMYGYPYYAYGGYYSQESATTEEYPDPDHPRLITTRAIDWLNKLRRAKLAVGEHVFAKWMGGGYFWGRIISTDDSIRATVQFDSYVGNQTLPIGRLQITEPSGVKTGDRVQVAQPDGSHAKGKITGSRQVDERVYQIQWDDGSATSSIPPSKVVPNDASADVRTLPVGAKVTAIWPPTSSYFPGTIAQVMSQSRIAFDVQLDDGKSVTAFAHQLTPPDNYVPVVGDRVTAPAVPWASGNSGVVTAILPASEPSYEVRWDDGSPPTFVAAKDILNRQQTNRGIGHSVFGIWFALGGGWLAAGIYRSAQRQPVTP